MFINPAMFLGFVASALVGTGTDNGTRVEELKEHGILDQTWEVDPGYNRTEPMMDVNAPIWQLLELEKDIPRCYMDMLKEGRRPADTYSMFPLAEECQACLRQGRKIFALTLQEDELHRCVDKEDFPAPSLGNFFAAHYACEEIECIYPWTAAAYRVSDVICHNDTEDSVPHQVYQETISNPCTNPTAYARRLAKNHLGNLPWSRYQTALENLMGESGVVFISPPLFHILSGTWQAMKNMGASSFAQTLRLAE